MPEIFFGSPDIATAVLLLVAGWITLKYIIAIPGPIGIESLFGIADMPFIAEGLVGIIKLGMIALVLYIFWPVLFYGDMLIILAIVAAATWATNKFFGFDYAWSAVAGLILVVAFTSNGIAL